MKQEIMKIKTNFLRQIGPDFNFKQLFENISGLLFFAKDIEGRICMANDLFAEHCGHQSEDDLIGKTDFDIFPPNLAERYVSDDEKIIVQKKPILKIIEPFPNHLGDPVWFMTNKFPIFDQERKIMGLCGTCQSYEHSSQFIRPYLEISEAVDYIKTNFRKKISVDQLADMVQLSKRQFQARFKKIFNTTPHHYILKLRILSSCELLLNSDHSISTITQELGFYDQSAYTKLFSKHMKMTPLQYMKKHS